MHVHSKDAIRFLIAKQQEVYSTFCIIKSIVTIIFSTFSSMFYKLIIRNSDFYIFYF